MTKEDYVSYEVAKLLKEKGFNIPIHTFYNPRKSTMMVKYDPCLIDRNVGVAVSAPTHQMAIKWLREVHNIYIEITMDIPYNFDKGHVFRYSIYDENIDLLHEEDDFQTYEEAVEAAIRYSLENLI